MPDGPNGFHGFFEINLNVKNENPTSIKQLYSLKLWKSKAKWRIINEFNGSLILKIKKRGLF